MTPAALSHQIRGLEDLLGLKLFHRRARSIELTEAARLIYPGIRTGFEIDPRGGRAARSRQQQDRVLVVSSTPGLTAKWLVPRLYKFLARHPEIETRITASIAYANFATDDIDVGIRLSSGNHPDLYVEKLSDEWLLPLCSPRLLEGEHPLRTPQDLRRFPLIQVDLPGIVPTWADWMQHGRASRASTARAGCASTWPIMRSMPPARASGVVLGYKIVASRDIGLGRLVVPFGPEVPLPGRAYYFVCAKGDEKRAPVKAFRDWLFAEIAETHAMLEAKSAPNSTKGSRRAAVSTR